MKYVSSSHDPSVRTMCSRNGGSWLNPCCSVLLWSCSSFYTLTYQQIRGLLLDANNAQGLEIKEKVLSLPYIDLQTAHSFTLWPGTEHGGPFSAQRRRNSVPQYTLPGFFYNFWHITDELEKIRQRHWKEGLKISKLANLEKFGKW